MTPIDPDVAAAVRQVLGFPDAAEPPGLDLVAAARVLEAADRSTAMDGGSVILTAVHLVWDCKQGGGTAEAARATIAGQAWTLHSHRDLVDVLAAMTAMSAAWASVEQLQFAASIGAALE